jgi:hypothetical protein
MRCAAIFALSAALCAVAAPVEKTEEALVKRGGYFDSNGKWVDDGYWAVRLFPSSRKAQS